MYYSCLKSWTGSKSWICIGISPDVRCNRLSSISLLAMSLFTPCWFLLLGDLRGPWPWLPFLTTLLYLVIWGSTGRQMGQTWQCATCQLHHGTDATSLFYFLSPKNDCFKNWQIATWRQRITLLISFSYLLDEASPLGALKSGAVQQPRRRWLSNKRWRSESCALHFTCMSAAHCLPKRTPQNISARDSKATLELLIPPVHPGIFWSCTKKKKKNLSGNT